MRKFLSLFLALAMSIACCTLAAAEDTAEDTANDNKVIVTETGRVIDGMHIDPEYAAANNLDPNTGESLDQESVLPDGYTGSADSEEDTVTKSEEAAMTGE